MIRPVRGQYKLPIPVYLERRRLDIVTPNITPEQEIETESTGLLFITEASSNANPDYIITE
tara:strand:+ start:34 stop:216 length:183 start_codon:yes stop_codon:yes gene_type:complete